ncbi:uncharacterized protein TRIVIDRAFT_45331 [Trichoderma virens Gv29-8]|uniref:N-terminal of MaoC-like dehydratase domain-containing protein n=1 Tax=Hypocrea virens (strain Gv29-8 / FGSC 10586) TaxID=413071 RepID=G9MQE5_HYPVG|nr:uncharacterized protein TRIVIDRAFT_45331 [Trichoderma virens Gv29-8]EHK24066.1 hypothetical protein TRIVIDRAFT_45331 [Trichoderma virens Gv29-8]UKZ50379.1 hypothetical protein TrVGV298_004639 [Trichoderma virens]
MPAPQIKSAAEAASHLMEHFAHKVTKRSQYIDPNQIQKLAIMLGRPVLNGHDTRRMNAPAGTPIPPAHHLVYFTPDDLEAQLGADGSDRTFNAPAPFTRRMWAGGNMKFDKSNPLRVGEEAEEHTKLISAVAKTSRSAGEMVLVEVEKKMYGSQGLALVDTRSWVFRPVLHSNSREGVALRSVNGNILAPSSISDDWTRTAEGHPGVVVHGPLNVINLLDYWRDVHGSGTGPDEISYRAMSPVYAGEEYQIRTLDILEATDSKIFEVVAEKDGIVIMKASIIKKT